MIEKKKCPQVLLLGNGLNRGYGSKSWEDGIQSINRPYKIDITSSLFEAVPFPLKAIIATEDNLETALNTEYAEKMLFGIEEVSKLREVLVALLKLKFDHILTTNYSYEIERVLDLKFRRNGTHETLQIRDFNKTTNPSGTTETKYLLHTYNEIITEMGSNIIWHIHGEGRKPNTVALGHYFYGKLLGKYQEEIQIRNREINNSHIGQKPFSWIDAFLEGDIYILGFGYDFSEYDLWWLLNEKKRNGAGKVIYYGHSEGEGGKILLLKTLGAEPRDLGFATKPKDYQSFYSAAIQDISKTMQGKKEPNNV